MVACFRRAGNQGGRGPLSVGLDAGRQQRAGDDHQISSLVRMNGRRDTRRFTDRSHEPSRTMLNPPTCAALARQLHEAERTRVQLEHFSKHHAEMEIADSYAIQRAWMQLKLAEGRVVKGHKIGLTSRAMQIASQITEPDHGTLLDDMFFRDGAEIPAQRFILPRVEVELAFVLGRALRGPGVTLFD